MLSEQLDVTKKQVESVFDVLGDLLEVHMRKRDADEFTFPKLCIKVRHVN